MDKKEEGLVYDNGDVEDAKAECKAKSEHQCNSCLWTFSESDMVLDGGVWECKSCNVYGMQPSKKSQEEKQMPYIDSATRLEHMCSNGTRFIANRADLRGGVQYIVSDWTDSVDLTNDFFEFGAWHAYSILPQLKHFQGYDCVDFSEDAFDGGPETNPPESCEQCETQLAELKYHEGEWLCASCKNDDLKRQEDEMEFSGLFGS